MGQKKILISLIFLVLMVSFSQAAFVLDRVVAIVNQEVISWSELYRTMDKDASAAIKALPENEKKKVYRENELMFLENLINFKLQLQESVSAGLRVGEEEIRETIDGIKQKYNMTDEQFQASLKTEGYDISEYRKRLMEQIMVSKIVNQQVRSKVLVTEPDVDNYIKENREIPGSSDAYKLRQIFFKRPKDMNENAALEARASSVYAKAVKGESFADLAKQHSEDATRDSGGDLGFIEKNVLAKEFSDAISSMKKGDVSRPFWSDRGIHILKLEDRSAARSAEEIREEVKRVLQNKLFTEKYNAWIKSLREKSFIDIRL